jgi:hypothetical protein
MDSAILCARSFLVCYLTLPVLYMSFVLTIPLLVSLVAICLPGLGVRPVVGAICNMYVY